MKLYHTRNWYRILCTLLTISLCYSLSLPVMASTDTEADMQPVNWQLQNDVLIGDGVAFYPVFLPIGYHLAPNSYYKYDQYVMDGNIGYAVQRPLDCSDIVWLSPWSDHEARLFATEEGANMLQDMLSGEVGYYAFVLAVGASGNIDFEESAAVTEEWVSGLSENGQVQSVEVSSLSELRRSEIRFYDQTGCIYMVAGMLYEYGERFWYVDHRTLGNQFFDADGNFSYRSGSVDVVVVSPDAAEAVWSCIASAQRTEGTIQYEKPADDLPGDNNYGKESVPVFWLFYVFNGFLLPIAPLVVGFVMANSKRRGEPKRWYILVGLSSAWILLAAVLAVILTH